MQTKGRHFRSLLPIIGFTNLLLIGVISLGLILLFFAYWFLPEVWFLGSMILRLPDLRWILSLLMLLSWSNILLAIIADKNWYLLCRRKLLQESKSLAFTKIISVFLFSYFFYHSFTFFSHLNFFGFPLLLIYFFVNIYLFAYLVVAKIDFHKVSEIVRNLPEFLQLFVYVLLANISLNKT